LRRQLKEAKQQKKSYFEELLAVKEKSLEDPLTGVYNREAYRIKIQESLNAEKPFVLMVLDIDDFKEINDKFGHKIGDNVLQRVMYYVKKQVRSTDLLARYGGDEFVIIMENADLANGEKKAENILKTLSKVEFHLDKTSRKILRITMSIGVAQRRQNDTAESLFERADKAMYLAKINGKNQCRSEKDISS
jgi:diguanylate cyclase